MKTCFKCHGKKPYSEFYAHTQTADGYLGKCKTCTIADAEARRLKKLQDPKWVEAERCRHREDSAKWRKEGRAKPVPAERRRVYLERHGIKYPEKLKARAICKQAIRRGHLERKPCHCGAKGQAHHEDYSKPLDVIWLCSKHHAERHVEIRSLSTATEGGAA